MAVAQFSSLTSVELADPLKIDRGMKQLQRDMERVQSSESEY